MDTNIGKSIHVITYPDSLGRDLKELDFALKTFFDGAVGGLHILPFYPSSGDRGFAPLTHTEVAPAFGDWADIRTLSEKYEITADLIVNHISSDSVFFRDYLRDGASSEYADYFITSRKFSRRILPHRKRTPVVLEFIERVVNGIRRIDSVFHLAGVNRASLGKIYRPRSSSPFVPFVFADGETEYLWCTFTKNQIDLDIYNDGVKKLLKTYIATLAKNGVGIVRLDAVGYAVKKRGTNGFMIPETSDFIAWLGRTCHRNGMCALPEVHNHYSYQIDLAGMRAVDFVYDFQLPLLVLQALYGKTTGNLKQWLKIRPTKTVSTLDTHDGIPIVDVKDVLSDREIDETSARILENGGNETRRASGDNGAENVDTYQINCTYYSALGEDDDAYIVARAIQFFIPGIPQVYYVGLLAGKNDADRFERTNIGRDVNRHDYTIDEIRREMRRPIVKRLLRLMRFRNRYRVFDGKFSFCSASESGDEKLVLRWRKGGLFFEATIDVGERTVMARYVDKKTGKERLTTF